jgi:protein ImuB
VWLKRLASDRIARRSGAPAESTPLVIVVSLKSALRIAALNNKAARLGLKAGMALADARAMYPALLVADADPQADQCLLQEIADWCDRYTPLVGLDPPDALVLDITGCAHLFGGEEQLLADLDGRLRRFGLVPRLAIADTAGASWALARYGRRDPAIVPSGGEKEALGKLPLAAGVSGRSSGGAVRRRKATTESNDGDYGKNSGSLPHNDFLRGCSRPVFNIVLLQGQGPAPAKGTVA